MGLPQEPIEKFAGHIAAMRCFVNYLVTMMQTFPVVMSKLELKQRQEIFESCVVPWAEFVKELYGRPDLYADAPNPLPVDQKCSGAAMSDHIKERLGRNHPLFDFVNAPFTHPLGTRISLLCINYSWDAYDTFVKELLGFLKAHCRDHPDIRALIKWERVGRKNGGIIFRLKQLWGVLWTSAGYRQKARDGTLTTNEKLRLLGILPDDGEIAAAVRGNYEGQSRLKAEQVPLTLQVAKELRTCFAHRFAQPSEKLLALIKSTRFEDFPIRLTKDGYEVTLVLSRMIAEVIQVMAHMINDKAVQRYGSAFIKKFRSEKG